MLKKIKQAFNNIKRQGLKNLIINTLIFLICWSVVYSPALITLIVGYVINSQFLIGTGWSIFGFISLPLPIPAIPLTIWLSVIVVRKLKRKGVLE
jgi:hypothetical protein